MESRNCMSLKNWLPPRHTCNSSRSTKRCNSRSIQTQPVPGDLSNTRSRSRRTTALGARCYKSGSHTKTSCRSTLDTEPQWGWHYSQSNSEEPLGSAERLVLLQRKGAKIIKERKVKYRYQKCLLKSCIQLSVFAIKKLY